MFSPNRSFLTSGIWLLALSLIVSSCAKATITPEAAPAAVGTTQRPSKILVYDFQVSADEVTQNQGPVQKIYRAMAKNGDQVEQDKLTAGQEAAHDLSQDLVKQLSGLGFDAQAVARGTQASPGDLIVDGEFLNADEGNRARRLIIGFGAGASRLETLVTVSQISPNGTPTQVLQFRTDSDSGKMPGAAMTMGAGAAAQGAAAAGGVTAVTSAGKIYNSELGTLAGKTSKQISAYMSQYFVSQNWISSDQAKSATIASDD